MDEFKQFHDNKEQRLRKRMYRAILAFIALLILLIIVLKANIKAPTSTPTTIRTKKEVLYSDSTTVKLQNYIRFLRSVGRDSLQ
jgi:hypothetical protein